MKKYTYMWTTKTKVLYVVYQCIAMNLPESRHMHFAKKIRRFFASKIIRSCSKDVNIEKGAKFTPDVSIGNRSSIGINCEIYGTVSIGNDVMMGPECVIYTQNHSFDRIDIPMIEQGYMEIQPVIIEDDVWIGRRVIILPGVTVGKGCVIGAGAVVTKSIPSFSVVGGVPAKVVKRR